MRSPRNIWYIIPADPAQLADIIGAEGFTIAILAVTNDWSEISTGESVEVVATGSVKAFGNGDVENYAQWSKNVGGNEWARMKKSKSNNVSVTSGEHSTKTHQVHGQRVQGEDFKYEIAAFGVSPKHQSQGLGARVLKEIEWLLGSEKGSISSGIPQVERLDFARGIHAPLLPGARLPRAHSEEGDEIHGVDLDKLKSDFVANTTGSQEKPERSSSQPGSRKLVLICVRELGNEDYYQKRGYKSIWSGAVPVGMWECKVECTMVYMMKNLS